MVERKVGKPVAPSVAPFIRSGLMRVKAAAELKVVAEAALAEYTERDGGKVTMGMVRDAMDKIRAGAGVREYAHEFRYSGVTSVSVAAGDTFSYTTDEGTRDYAVGASVSISPGDVVHYTYPPASGGSVSTPTITGTSSGATFGPYWTTMPTTTGPYTVGVSPTGPPYPAAMTLSPPMEYTLVLVDENGEEAFVSIADLVDKVTVEYSGSMGHGSKASLKVFLKANVGVDILARKSGASVIAFEGLDIDSVPVTAWDGHDYDIEEGI